MVVAILAFGGGWWASSSRTKQGGSDPSSLTIGPEHAAPAEAESGVTRPSSALSSERAVLDPAVPDEGPVAQPETSEPAVSHYTDEFYRKLAGAERVAFLAKHRWDYIRANRDSILRNLEELEDLEAPQDRYSKANSALQSSIALILDVQNRAVAWEPGVPVSHDLGRGGWYSFLSSNWIYRVHEDEFPEIAYFHAGAPRDLDPATGDVRFLPLDPQRLAEVHQRASQALELYDHSKPPAIK